MHDCFMTIFRHNHYYPTKAAINTFCWPFYRDAMENSGNFFPSFAEVSSIHCLKYLTRRRSSVERFFLSIWASRGLTNFFSGSFGLSFFSLCLVFSAFWFMEPSTIIRLTSSYWSSRGKKFRSRIFHSQQSRFVHKSFPQNRLTSTKVLFLQMTSARQKLLLNFRSTLCFVSAMSFCTTSTLIRPFKVKITRDHRQLSC